jgi:S-formylglutathione hydrolase FrmB
MKPAGVALAFALVACGKPAQPPPQQQPAPAPAPQAAPSKPKAKSTVVTETFHSAALGVDKDVKIYLPAGYDPTDARRYPVLYYLNGLGGDETNWVELAKLDVAANALGLEAIVVMPDGDNNFYVDGLRKEDHAACMKDGTGMFIPTQPRKKTCVRASNYETYIVKDLVGWVDGKYKTITGREGRGIAGLSMGGFGALTLAMRHPGLFSAVASHSGLDALLYQGPFPYEKGKVVLAKDTSGLAALGRVGDWLRSIFGDDLAFWRAHDPATLVHKLAPGTLKIYLDCGTEDLFAFHNGMQYLHDLLLEKQIDHEYYLGPGGHDFAFWTERLPKSLAFFRKSLAPAQ